MIGTLETSILPFTRTMYAKGRDGALHVRYAPLHKSWRTSWVATGLIGIVGLGLSCLGPSPVPGDAEVGGFVRRLLPPGPLAARQPQ